MLELDKPITLNGQTYEPDDFYKRKLFVVGVQPTDYEDYQYVNVAVLHKIKTKDAGGQAQVFYKHMDLADLKQFNEHEFPYYIDVVMTTVTDKKGEPHPVILKADFSSIQEMQLVERKKTATKTEPKV